MPLAAAQIESAAPDAWSGKAASVIYEPAATVAAALVLRGFPAFDASTLAEQEAALIRVTEDAEDALRRRFRGRAVTRGQGLLLPARGAYDYQAHLLLSSGDLTSESSVRAFLGGIGRLAEHLRAGTYMPLAEPGSQLVKSESSRRGRTEFRDGADPMSLAANHPATWRRLRQILPRMR